MSKERNRFSEQAAAASVDHFKLNQAIRTCLAKHGLEPLFFGDMLDVSGCPEAVQREIGDILTGHRQALKWSGAKSVNVKGVVVPDLRCDARPCSEQVAVQCHCRRCESEPSDGRFHACRKHVDSSDVESRHKQIYPSYDWTPGPLE